MSTRSAAWTASRTYSTAWRCSPSRRMWKTPPAMGRGVESRPTDSSSRSRGAQVARSGSGSRCRGPVGADDPADRRVLEHRPPNDLVPKARDPETVAVDPGRLHPTHVRLHSLGCPRHGRRDIVTRLFAQAPDLVDYARVVVLGQCEEPNSLIAHALARLVGHR